MARRKKPESETAEQARMRRALETISNAAPRGEKVSWERKLDNMVKLLAKLRPIEEQITNLMAKKQPIFDEVTMLRAEMVRDCVHPIPYLLVKVTEEGECIECKFCNRRFLCKK